jgi:monoamine oxidase
MTKLTRRQVVASAAATAAASALPADTLAAKRPRTRRVRRRRGADVIVVGAGFAGLTAARAIAKAGRSVHVIEARPRVGGRTLNHALGAEHPGKIIEVGGQWIGPTQDRLAALADELDVKTYKTYNAGDAVLVYKGRRATFATTGPLGPIPPVPDGLVDAATAIQKLNDMAASIDVQRPWQAARGLEWDAQTFETWKLANTTTEGGRFLLDLGFTSVFAAEPRDVSLLYSLFYIASAGNERAKGTFDRLINTAGGAQESRFAGGSQLVALRAAEDLKGRITLNAPVRRIAQSGGAVQVVTDRATYTGRHVVVAVPPALLAGIEFVPGLPALRTQLHQRMPMGIVIKCQAVYDEPFWRKDGLAGYANSDTDPVRLTFDNSPPGDGPGVLLGFIEGDAARRWIGRSAADRRAAVLDNLATLFGPRARDARDYVELSWANETWSGGCYEGYMPPGVLTAYGPLLREPVGRIHWAGTETSDYWTGYLDGAVRSGERAAREVLG